MTYQCGSTAELGIGAIWLILTYVYFALLQIIGIILAIQTRKVKVKVLNDSKYIAAMIYISSIVLLLLGIVTAVFATSINITEILFSGGLLFATSAFLCLVFIPKVSMYCMYRSAQLIQYNALLRHIQVTHISVCATICHHLLSLDQADM